MLFRCIHTKSKTYYKLYKYTKKLRICQEGEYITSKNKKSEFNMMWCSKMSLVKDKSFIVLLFIQSFYEIKNLIIFSSFFFYYSNIFYSSGFGAIFTTRVIRNSRTNTCEV